MSPVLAFGDDRSAQADECWSWIISQRWDGWDLEIITAEPRVGLRPDSEEAELHSWEPESPRDAGETGFGSVVNLHTELDPRAALIAKDWDLVAIGPRGSGLLKRLHLGSTADWLLREPTSPLLIAHESGPVRDVLFAADGSSHASAALDCLSSLPWITEATVHVVVVDDGHVSIEETAQQAEAVLSAAGIETVRVVRSGRPAHEILVAAEEIDPDLIVMGARGQEGIKGLVIGSTTSAVSSSSQTSLLVAHAH